MVKAPVAGRVKTRLGRDIGMVPAACWFRHQLNSLARRLCDRRWQMSLAVAPDRAVYSAALPGHLPRIAQGHGDLGTRMARIIRAAPPGPVVLIGADIPGIRRAHIERGFKALGTHDAVFGPATDGGYWLTGFARRRALPPRLFQGVAWASELALSDSLATLNGQRFALTDRLIDIDTAADLAALIAR